MSTMSLNSRSCYPEWVRIPHSSLMDNPVLPPLATAELRTARFGRQALESFNSSATRIPQLVSSLASQAQQYPEQLPNETYSRNVPRPQPKSSTILPSTTGQPKPSVVQFEFIQIKKPSGKTDSSGGANMRTHIMKRYHENRRRQNAGTRTPFSQLPIPQICSTSHRCLPAAPGQLVSMPSQLRGQQSDLSQTRVFLETMKSGVVCAQCGRLILQNTRDEDGIERNGLVGAPQGLLDSAPHDPFDSSAIPISHKMHGLIHHFIHLVIYPTNAPIYEGDGFRDLMNVVQISLALSDPVCVRAVIAIAASHLSAIKLNALAPYDWMGREEAKELTGDAIGHMSEGVRLLNERFEDPKQSLTVASVFGAALLGLCPLYIGDISLAEAHHEGMLKMIELRGGINALPRYLASQMIRLSSNMTWKKKTRTRLPMYNSRFRKNGVQVSAVEICNKGADELFPANSRYVALQPASSPFCNNLFETFLWGELFPVACDLHMLSYMLDLNARHPKKLGSVQREYFEDTYAATLNGLAAFQYPDDIGVMKTVAYYRQHAWRLAAIIYVKTGIRKSDKVMHPVQGINEYISALHALDLENLWVFMPEVLVWMLFIGTCGTWDGLELSWMQLELRRGLRLLNIKSAEELEKLLKSMLLTNSLKERYLYVIWQAVSA